MLERLFNMHQIADLLGANHEAVINWIEKGWVKPKKDYRNYPVFTDEDMQKIKKWQSRLVES